MSSIKCLVYSTDNPVHLFIVAFEGELEVTIKEYACCELESFWKDSGAGATR
jgi:hypothetical protein